MIETLKKQWFVVLVALIFIGFAVYCVYDTNKGKLPSKSKDGKDVVATMKDYTLTADDVYEDLFKQYGGEATLYNQFQNLVADKTVKTSDELKKRADEIKEILQSQAQTYASYYGVDSETWLKQQLLKYGFEEDDIDGYALISAKTESIANAYMDAHLDELFAPIYKEKQSRKVSHILIKCADPDNPTEEEQKKMDEVDQALKDGKSFAEVAKDKSDDTASKENGGALGYMDSDTSYVDSFKKKALSMKSGEVSDWVKESNDNYKGFHKIFVEETEKDALEKDEDLRTGLYSAIANANPKLAYTYMWEAAQKAEVSFGSDEIKQQLLDYMGIKE